MHSYIGIAVVLVIPIVVYLVQRSKRSKMEAHRDIQLALLEKFSTAEEMSEFLSTPEGRRLVDRLAEPDDKDPRRMTLNLVVGGCIQAAIGIGFLVASSTTGVEKIALPAYIILGVGVGLFVAAAMTHIVSKKLGLVRDEERR